MIIEIETDFEGGTQKKNATDFYWKSADLLSPPDQEELEDVAYYWETCYS